MKEAKKPVAVAKAAAPAKAVREPVKAATTKAETSKVVASVAEKKEEKAPAAEVKAAPAAVKKEPVKAEKKAPAKKAPVKKAVEKKEADKPVKAVKETAKKETVKEAAAIVNVQFAGKSYSTEDLVKIAKDVWKFDMGKKVTDFKTVELYVKPEESVVYFVVNGDVNGSFAI